MVPGPFWGVGGINKDNPATRYPSCLRQEAAPGRLCGSVASALLRFFATSIVLSYVFVFFLSELVQLGVKSCLVQDDKQTKSAWQAKTLAIASHRPLPEQRKAPRASTCSSSAGRAENVEENGAEIYRQNWQQAYGVWRTRLLSSEKTPDKIQWQFMNAVHARCVLEHNEECDGTNNKSRHEPSRLLAHGLPGSGKTQVMKWVAEYFREVWRWQAGLHFVFLAPLNTMAARIDGSTVHSWGEIGWQCDTPGGSATLGGGTAAKHDMSSMAAKCELLRWMFIDEIEALGADILGMLEENMAAAARASWYKFRQNAEGILHLRPFGGVNVAFLGDFLAVTTCAATEHLFESESRGLWDIAQGQSHHGHVLAPHTA